MNEMHELHGVHAGEPVSGDMGGRGATPNGACPILQSVFSPGHLGWIRVRDETTKEPKADKTTKVDGGRVVVRRSTSSSRTRTDECKADSSRLLLLRYRVVVVVVVVDPDEEGATLSSTPTIRR